MSVTDNVYLNLRDIYCAKKKYRSIKKIAYLIVYKKAICFHCGTLIRAVLLFLHQIPDSP